MGPLVGELSHEVVEAGLLLDSSEAKKGVRRRLELQSETRADQNDHLASLRQSLVEQTLGVPEYARERVLRHDTATGLVGDEDNRTGKPSHALRQILRRGRKIPVFQEKIAEPKGRAIGDDNAIRPGLPAERFGKRERLFHKRPARVA